MQYSITYQPDKEIVLVNIQGRLNYQLVERFSKEAVKLARENSCSNFLINHTETEASKGVFNIHSDGDELQQFGFKKTDRVAMVISKPAGKEVIPEFESLNNQWCTVKYFDGNKIRDAEDWLTADDK